MRRLPILSLILLPAVSHAADFDGATLSLFWGAPFALILLSIALGPLFFAHTWHHHFGKITAFWTLLFLVPFAVVFGFGAGVHTVVHALVEEYIPFILLLLALYTISGGILVWGKLNGTPALNTGLLAAGTVMAFSMGTTGGGLTPLGDPPLFLGFLKGVDFMWTVKHMLMPVLISTVVLLLVFYIIDSRYHAREANVEQIRQEEEADEDLRIAGKWNFLLLAGVVGAVLLSGLWKPDHPGFEILGSHYALQNLVRDVILLVLTMVSLLITPKQVRAGNEFNFDPIAEVGKLFLGIFITISPVLAILKAGEAGALGAVVSLVHDASGNPINTMYFWMSGLLSAFLDNAPTYLVFFNMAGGDAQALMTAHLFHSLLAVSMGSVFMGALTYIGNAPNFMVKAIAEQRGVPMPTFFGYMMWSVGVLIPLFIVHTLIFFVWQLF